MKPTFNCTNHEPVFVAPLHCLTRTDLERGGGKAANLGELVRAGFPVPPGFAVTTAAYEQFIGHNGLVQTIARVIQEQPGSGGKAIRDAIEVAPIPLEVEQNILEAYRQLGQGPVAVRSSATAEDLPEAAFAGQQDTYLNVMGADALLAAVRRCWASLWTDRAIVYRARQQVDPLAVKLAVVVQRMVAADIAGVLFTANPVTGARSETIIDASPGLGEAVVSGLVTPDHFVLQQRRWGWRIAARQAGKHEVVIQALAGGGTEHITGSSLVDGPQLSDDVLRRLARYGGAIQRHFGVPQDIEWAWAGGKLFILQARPITALPGPPPHTTLIHRMLANNFAEMLPVRPYPLDLDTWIPALGRAVEPLFELLGLEWQLNQMFEAEDGVVVRYNIHLPDPTWKTLLAPVRLAANIWRYNPFHWQSDALLVESIARTRELEARPLSTLSWEELLAMVRAAGEIPYFAAGEIRRRYFPRAAFAAARMRVMLFSLGQAGKFGTLLSGADNKTLEMNQALEGLAHTVRMDPTLTHTFAAHPAEALPGALEELPTGRAFLANLSDFLHQYGHRETVISTALQPTWKDAPAVALSMIKSFAAHPAPPPTSQPAWQVARDEVLQHPLLRFAPVRSIFLELLAAARTWLRIREDTHFYATLPMPVFRRTLLEFGTRLAATGILNLPEDIFHLKLAELEWIASPLPPPSALAVQLRATMLRRKQARARLEDKPLVDPRIFPPSLLRGDELLSGMSGSPGTAEGPVCIVRDSSEFDKLVPGDVLVAPYTNPAWTPLFQRAVAVVVDTGSLASHAAIVAREYGIPAVMATMTGTRTLHDGERIRVDGSRGAVYSAAVSSAASPTSAAAGHELTD